ncbi:MAG: MATE family efflux transporter [Alphaproteobacteria bacterium]|nr:MATE family efflux transporter [Alphaproteobacteria bacterium]
MKSFREDLFQKMDVRRAVLTLVWPTIISQLIGVVYNMSDSFWIGQLNSPAQMAAATLCLPTFLFTMGISNIFGIGGASLMARCLGTKNYKKARATCSFCVWTAIVCALIYSFLFYVFDRQILHFIGATEETYLYSEKYAFWVVVLGAIPATLNGLFGHLVRSEGYAKQASFGMVLGLVLNIILDPVFIFVLNLEIVGAAIATILSMMVGCGYFIWFIKTRPAKSILTLKLKYYQARKRIASEVLLVGFPSTLMSFMAVASNVVLNVLTAGYSTFAIAGMGIAKRLDMVIFAISNGMGQGVLPLIGYTYAAKDFKRLRSAIKITFIYSMILAVLITLYLYFGANWTTQLFIEEPTTVAYGRDFLKIICLTCPCVSLTLIIMTIFQAAGKKIQPTILSIIRKGGLDIPLMFILNAWIGVMGLAWAIPVEDVLAMVVAIGLFIPFWRELKKKEKGAK